MRIVKKLYNYVKGDLFIRDNFSLLISMTILNVAGYLFHFYMGRTLGPSAYGVLGVLLSLVYIIIVPLTVIQTTITKFVSNLKSNNEYGKISLCRYIRW